MKLPRARIAGAEAPACLMASIVAGLLAGVLMSYPLQLFADHSISLWALPLFAAALVAGPAGAALAALASIATTMNSGLPIAPIAVTLPAAIAVGIAHRYVLHPAWTSLLVPPLLALVLGVVEFGELGRVHSGLLLDVGISLVLAQAAALGAQRTQLRCGIRVRARPMAHRIFVVLAAITAPFILAAGAWSGNSMRQSLIESQTAELEVMAREASESVRSLLAEKARSLSAYGRALAVSGAWGDSLRLSEMLQAYILEQPALLTMLIADADGELVATAAHRPLSRATDDVQVNVSDREYFRAIVDGRPSFVSGAFKGRGFGNDLIVAVSAPVATREQPLLGVIEASLDLTVMQRTINSLAQRDGLEYALVDNHGVVVVARGAGIPPPGGRFTRPDPAPDGDDMVAEALVDDYGWRVHVALPRTALRSALEFMHEGVIRNTGIALVVTLLVSLLLSSWLARPLREFATALAEDPDGTHRTVLVRLRHASREVREFALQLLRAQRQQARARRGLHKVVAEKQRLNEELRGVLAYLDAKVEARTKVLADREQELRASEVRWRTMAEIAPDAVIVIDEDNRIAFVNSAAERLTGHAAADLAGQSLEVLVPEQMRERHLAGMRRYISSGERKLDWRSTEAQVVCKDGSQVPCEVAFGEFTLEGRHYFAGYFRDITVRKQVEGELLRARHIAESANRAKDVFLATVSHEIRTPLHGMIGTLDLLAGERLEGRAGQRLQIARNSAHALLQIANDMVDLSRIDAGTMKIEKVAFDLHDLVAEVVGSFEAGAAGKGLSLSQVVERDVAGWVDGDPLRLRQVLSNLVNNALKFTERGGVSVHVRRLEGDTVAIDVRDSGIGVPESLRATIFERFAQADGNHNRRYGGAGLGLAIAHLLARAMGGELTLHDTGATGSVFRLALPLSPVAEPEAEAAATTMRHKLLADRLHDRRVLVVDDNPANRIVAEAYLQELGVACVLADCAAAALAELEKGAFDAVMMDVQMPGMDGYQATREIRGRMRLDLPVIAVTANAGPGERARCTEAGMTELLVKPFACADLGAMLTTVLGQPRARAEPQPEAPAREPEVPLVDGESSRAVMRFFRDRPEMVRKLLRTLHESVTAHLADLAPRPLQDRDEVARRLHGLKGAAAMYGAERLRHAAQALEAQVHEGRLLEDLEREFDKLDAVGRQTLAEVARLIDKAGVA